MIIANMATFPARAPGLREAVARIVPQVDRLNLCLNDYDTPPKWLASIPSVDVRIPDRDLKDLGKFLFEVGREDDVFLVDDDIPYPQDYVQKSLDRRNTLPSSETDMAVFGYHGTIYQRRSAIRFAKDLVKGRNIFRPQIGRAKILHAYHQALGKARIVTQLGTGTVLAKGRHIPDLSYMLGGERRADVRFARWCFENGVSQVCLPRPEGWMPIGGDDEISIYNTYTKGLPAEMIAELRSYAFRVPRRGQFIDAMEA